jgi:hypothetical protein
MMIFLLTNGKFNVSLLHNTIPHNTTQVILIFFLSTNIHNNFTSLLLTLILFELPYILESNAYPFYSFRGLKNQMRIRFACGLDSRSRAGFWKND